jgi:hypothetical protein
MSKQKSPTIDYMALSKTMVLYGFIFLLLIVSVVGRSGDQPEYDSCDGIVVDKFAVHDTDRLSGETFSYYYLVVDCNGTNRTKMFISEQMLEWKYTEIGDIEHVCWQVED